MRETSPAEAAFNGNCSCACFMSPTVICKALTHLCSDVGDWAWRTSKALGRAGDQRLLLGKRVRDSQGGSAGTHQLRGYPIQPAERVVQEVEAGSGAEVWVVHLLVGEERLADPAAESAAHRAVVQVQLPGDSGGGQIPPTWTCITCSRIPPAGASSALPGSVTRRHQGLCPQ